MSGRRGMIRSSGRAVYDRVTLTLHMDRDADIRQHLKDTGVGDVSPYLRGLIRADMEAKAKEQERLDDLAKEAADV